MLVALKTHNNTLFRRIGVCIRNGRRKVKQHKNNNSSNKTTTHRTQKHPQPNDAEYSACPRNAILATGANGWIRTLHVVEELVTARVPC